MSFDEVKVVAQLADTLLLLIRKEDVNNEEAIGIQVHLNRGNFDKGKINLFTKFTPFESVDSNNNSIQKYYQQLMYRKLNDKILFEILSLISEDE